MYPLQKVLFLIPKSEPPRLSDTKFSTDFRSFVDDCCAMEPRHRQSASELLRHPFIACEDAASTHLLRPRGSSSSSSRQRVIPVAPRVTSPAEEALLRLQAETAFNGLQVKSADMGSAEGWSPDGFQGTY